MNFNPLGLKKLIATCYSGSPIAGGEYQPSLFDDDVDENTGRHRRAYKAVVNVFRDTTGDGGLDMDDIRNLLDSGENELTELHGDGTYGAGDFRSKECLELLDEADIVVTNPPFSLFREYVATLVEHGKKFVIMGNINAITYKEIFPLIRDGRLWPGFSFNKAMEFAMPEEYESKTGERDKYGRKISKVPAIAWYTNLDIDKRHEDLILYRRYADDPSKYPHYDNYDAIEVSQGQGHSRGLLGRHGCAHHVHGQIQSRTVRAGGLLIQLRTPQGMARGYGYGTDRWRQEPLQAPVHPPSRLIQWSQALGGVYNPPAGADGPDRMRGPAESEKPRRIFYHFLPPGPVFIRQDIPPFSYPR